MSVGELFEVGVWKLGWVIWSWYSFRTSSALHPYRASPKSLEVLKVLLCRRSRCAVDAL